MKLTVEARRADPKPREAPVVGLQRFHNEGVYRDDVPFSYTYYTAWAGPICLKTLIEWRGACCD